MKNETEMKCVYFFVLVLVQVATRVLYLCMLLWIPVYVHILYTEKVPCTSLCRHVLHIVQSFKHVLHCSFVFVFIFSF